MDDSNGPSILIAYDVMNRVLSKTVTDGATSQVTSYQWDTRDRLVTATDALGHVSSRQYDIPQTNGSLIIIDQPTSITDALGNKTLFSYDSRDRLLKKKDAKGGVTAYAYNSRGDLTGLTDPSGLKTLMNFDGNRRLISETRPSSLTQANGKTVAAQQVTQ